EERIQSLCQSAAKFHFLSGPWRFASDQCQDRGRAGQTAWTPA
ncbi:uncharacterized, partial [Tachysurus ichikawai]